MGLILVDPATGAMWGLPETVDVSLTPTGTSTPRPPAKVEINPDSVQ
ncbi:MAG: hypothetical protein HOP02_12800 [Methylococcaceae bacterium]|nr:hypothetical protein [Methylococcaceae bacterium]